MSSEAQRAANQANAQLSTGPVTEEGKAASSRNHLQHGLSAKPTYEGLAFCVLPWENAQEFGDLQLSFMSEFSPRTEFEIRLIERMAQHHWLVNRAVELQNHCFFENGDVDEKRLALLLRYQTTHERAFHKCLKDLQIFQAARQKKQIGFESQKQLEAEKQAKAAAKAAAQQTKETRAQELHAARVRLTNARASHIEIDSDIKQTIEAPLPGHMRIPFEDLGAAFRTVVRQVSDNLLKEQAA